MAWHLATALGMVGAVCGCSSSGSAASGTGGADASEDAALPEAAEAGIDASALALDAGMDASLDASPFIVGLSIASSYGTPLEGAPGDAIPLVVVLTLSDGTTQQAAASNVTWLAPETLSAEDPYDAGADVVPEAGALPTAFYVQNDYRHSAPGALYIVDHGTVAAPSVTVTASVADAGTVSASVTILAAPTGDPDAGGNLFQNVLLCNGCHGVTGGGSPLVLLADGGPVLVDGGPAYSVGGQSYPFPAPGLNAASPGNLAVDPAWSAALLGMAAQSDMDNQGVALRVPMPMWLGGNDGNGRALDAQDFANIYAWLKTQTQ